MDITLYFMRLEDKYWGIFLVSVFFLLVVTLTGQKKTKKRFPNIAIYGLVAYVVFLCPLTYRLTAERFAVLSTYYEVSYAQLVVPIMVLAGTIAFSMAEKEGKHAGVILLVVLFLLLMLSGDFAYLPSKDPDVSAECSSEEQEAFDLLLEHARERGDGDVRIWGMNDLMARSRLYNDAFCPVYGKDIQKKPENYSESLQMLYQWYSLYDVKEGTAINVGDQIDALAGLPYQFPETECEYVILYDPAVQFEDYDTYFGENGMDAVDRFCSLGYESVGRTETFLLFYKQEG